MTILKSNLLWALKIAIVTQQEKEQRQNPKYESCFVAGLKQVVRALENGDWVEIKYDDY